VLAKSEYAFVPDVHLFLAKLGPHLVLDGSDCIDFGIDTPLRRMARRISVSLHAHYAPAASCATTSTPSHDYDINQGIPSRGYLDQCCIIHALDYLDIVTKVYHLA
jgi:hypothetical protein